MWVQFYFAGDGSMHSSQTPCSFVPDVMALLLLLPSGVSLNQVGGCGCSFPVLQIACA